MKKLLAIVTALVMVCALSVSVFAIEGSQDLVLCTQDNVSWQTHVSDRVTVDGAGEYTFTLSGLSFDGSAMTVLYVKDANAVDVEVAGGTYDGANGLTGMTILTKSVKINGTEVALTDGYVTGTNPDSGLIDICWYNIWATSFMDAPAGTVNDIEVVLEVVDENGEAAPAEAEEAPAETEEAAPAEAEEAPAEAEEAPAEAAPAETAEEAPAATETAKAPSTGIALAVIPAVMALAAAAVSKKH